MIWLKNERNNTKKMQILDAICTTYSVIIKNIGKYTLTFSLGLSVKV